MHSCIEKLGYPWNVCSRRLQNPGEIRPSLTSSSKQASAQYLWQPQSLSISSEQTCQIPPWNTDAAYMWMRCDSIGGRQDRGKSLREKMRKGRLEVEKHAHLLNRDQHQHRKPTFWVLVWHSAEICRGQTQLWTTCLVIGLIFEFDCDYAVILPPVGTVGH